MCVFHRSGFAANARNATKMNSAEKLSRLERQSRIRVALRMLVGIDAELQVLAAHQRRDAHAVVVDQLDLKASVVDDHDVSVLQVAVRDLRGRKLGDRVDPELAHAGQRPHVSLQDTGSSPNRRACRRRPIPW